jgi:predicted ribosomally synthesized peptide with SipW-like signal peptide
MNKYILSIKSIILLLILVLGFTGATYAWFTDSVTNEDNRIQAGNLKIKFEASDTLDGIYRDLSNGADPVFDFGTNAQPGDGPFVAFIKVTNTGSILLSYQIEFLITDADLEEVVFFEIEKVVFVGENNNYLKTNIDGFGLESEELEGFDLIEDAFEIYKITMSFDADNDYNLDDDDESYPLSFLFDIKLYAYQASDPNPFDDLEG